MFIVETSQSCFSFSARQGQRPQTLPLPTIVSMIWSDCDDRWWEMSSKTIKIWFLLSKFVLKLRSQVLRFSNSIRWTSFCTYIWLSTARTILEGKDTRVFFLQISLTLTILWHRDLFTLRDWVLMTIEIWTPILWK